jgi:hypothetical protein
MEAIVERDNLRKALAQVKRNKGAAGVDGMSLGALAPYLKEHWPTIRAQLLDGTYKPQPVRRVEIPKNVSVEAAERRSLGLIRELIPADTPMPRLDVQELAATALRTIALKELSDDRDNVIAEVPVYGSIGAVDRLIAGRADAVRYRNGDAEIVFDWKSDVDRRAEDRAAYAHQLAQYVHVLRAKRGAIVYMTTGEIQWVESAKVAPM